MVNGRAHLCRGSAGHITIRGYDTDGYPSSTNWRLRQPGVPIDAFGATLDEGQADCYSTAPLRAGPGR